MDILEEKTKLLFDFSVFASKWYTKSQGMRLLELTAHYCIALNISEERTRDWEIWVWNFYQDKIDYLYGTDDLAD